MTRLLLVPLCFLAALLNAMPSCAQPSPAALAGFRQYTQAVEARLALQHRSPSGFPAAPPGALPTYEQLTPPAGVALAGAQMHHWRASAFVAGAHLADFEHLLRDLPDYPRHFAPDILRASILRASILPTTISGPPGPAFQATLRVRQKHVLTVVLDTTYDIALERLDARHGFSSSRSTSIREIASAGMPEEHVLSPGEEHGFLWAQNTYWSYREIGGNEGVPGLVLQVESVSLSRAIPTGLGWAVRPFVQSVPRESLAFTLERTALALRTR